MEDNQQHLHSTAEASWSESKEIMNLTVPAKLKELTKSFITVEMAAGFRLPPWGNTRNNPAFKIGTEKREGPVPAVSFEMSTPVGAFATSELIFESRRAGSLTPVSVAHYGSIPVQSDRSSKTYEACIGAAIEEGIQLSRASTGKVMLHRDEPGRTCMEGMMYIGEGAADPRDTEADSVTLCLQAAFLEADVFCKAEAPINKAKKLTRVYLDAMGKWEHTQRELRRCAVPHKIWAMHARTVSDVRLHLRARHSRAMTRLYLRAPPYTLCHHQPTGNSLWVHSFAY